jgi:rhodanese-related sulfurtransferase
MTKALLGMLLAIALAACGSTQNDPPSGEEFGQLVPVAEGGSYLDILPVELESMLKANRESFLVNVHVPNEGEIEGTDVHIPFDQITSLIAQFPADKEAVIILYCRSGSMSAIAARDLVTAGYTSVYNLDGGFRAWLQAGYELTN